MLATAGRMGPGLARSRFYRGADARRPLTFPPPALTFIVMTDRAFQQCINPACAATYGVDEVQGRLHEVRQPARHPLRLGPPARPARASASSSTAGAPRAPAPQGRLDFSGVWRFRELMPFYRTEDDIVTIGEGRTHAPAGRPARQADGHEAGHAAAPVRRPQPQRQLQRQRHDGRVHARADGGGEEGRVRVDRQHVSASLAMFASLAEMQGVVFIGSGQDLLRQAVAGAGLRCADAPDPGRLRRLPPARAADRGRRARAGHLPDEQRQPVPPRGAEEHHVPHPRGPRLGAAGLGHRARRQPRELLGVRQGVRGAEGARAGQEGPAARDHQRQRRQHAQRAVSRRRA